MKNMIGDAAEILRRDISGFHRYILAPSGPRLCFVSESLSRMVGFTEEELLGGSEDQYTALVHPADREKYSAFLHKLTRGEQTLTAEYRLVGRDGSVIHVRDTVTARFAEDGALVGSSVLTDITDLKAENSDLRFLNENIPCGILRYTCENQPRITYMSDQMLKILRFPEYRDGEADYLEMCKDNIYLMIPMEERRRFALFLNRVYTEGVPVTGELTVLRCDGTKAYLSGWVTKCVNERGEEEFQSVCIDITEKHNTQKDKETKRYLKALTDVYDMIFEYDLSSGAVKCVHGKNSAFLKRIENIPMQMREATELWIGQSVFEGDRGAVRAFFECFYRERLSDSELHPPQIKFRMPEEGGKLSTYTGTFLKLDTSVSLFCSRRAAEPVSSADGDDVRNSAENMEEFVKRFTDGIAAFEVTDGFVTPIYASDNVCEFFGFTKDEWMPLMKRKTPVKAFVARSRASYEEFDGLLRNGEAKFSYTDVRTGTERGIRAVCSRRVSAGVPRYIMLYEADGGQRDAGSSRGTAARLPGIDMSVQIRTFGYFDVFVDGKPIAFRSQKSKELFALLVDRRGGYVSSEEAISFLWENEPVSSVTLARYRKVALRLKNILEEYGIAGVMEAVDGKRRIVTDRVQCDLYDYLSGREEFSGLFKGSYLTNYSWGEMTLGELRGNT